ncbi:MAG: tetratricopeptide repeat protein, partial [Thermoanaerobaculia bacterium]
VFSGVILHERGDEPRAEKHLKRAVALYPDSFLPHFSLGAVYAAHGRLSRAVVLLERAVEIDAVPQALFLLGSCLYEMGKLTGSIRTLQQLVRQDPANEEAHHLMGLAYLDRGWRRKALEAFRLAQRLNPKRLRYRDLVRYLSSTASSPLPAVAAEARAWLFRAEGHLKRDQTEPAFNYFRKALELSPESPTLLLSYALACLRHDRSREAERTARRLLELEPEEMLRVTAYAALMEALRGEGRWREGNREGERLLEEGQTDFARTIAYYEMAHNLAEMEEDLDRALEFALRSLELAPQELRQFPLAAVGWVHYKREEFPQAVDYLGRAAELARTASTLTHLGMALLAAGEEKQARDVLAEARHADERGDSLEQRMMECLQDSNRLHDRVHAKARPADR